MHYTTQNVSKANEVKPEIWNSVNLLTFADNNVIIGQEEYVKTAAIDIQLVKKGNVIWYRFKNAY